MKRIIAFLLIILVFSFKNNPSIKLVTGPSHGEVLIRPIGFSENGNVLCLTEYSVNPLGAHDLMDTEFGYLIVNKNGLWIENVVKTIYNIDGFEVFNKYKKEFYLPVDFKKPPKHLIDVIEKYNIEFDVWRKNENLYFWNSNGLMGGNSKIIHKNVQQNSIKSLTNTPSKGTMIGNSYEIKGVVFFENYETYDPFSDSTIHAGAYFLEDKFDYPLDIYHVTGIVLKKN